MTAAAIAAAALLLLVAGELAARRTLSGRLARFTGRRLALPRFVLTRPAYAVAWARWRWRALRRWGHRRRRARRPDLALLEDVAALTPPDELPRAPELKPGDRRRLRARAHPIARKHRNGRWG